tara:strand:- start:213 stop:389 length:177 start_codon:yes stop_codon:yes gene_type:complete
MVDMLVLPPQGREMDVVVVEVVPVVLLLDLVLREILLVIRLVVMEKLSHNSLDLEYIL